MHPIIFTVSILSAVLGALIILAGKPLIGVYVGFLGLVVSLYFFYKPKPTNSNIRN